MVPLSTGTISTDGMHYRIPYPKIERWDRRQGKRNPQKHKANSLGSSRFLYFQFFNVEPDLKVGEFFMVQVIFVEPFNEFMNIL